MLMVVNSQHPEVGTTLAQIEQKRVAVSLVIGKERNR